MNLLELFAQTVAEQNQNLSLLSTKQIKALLHKYPDNQQLWNEFWKWYARKAEDDKASDEVLFATANAMEAAWAARVKAQIDTAV